MTASPLGCGLGEPRAPSFILGYPAAPVVTPLLINNTVEFSLTEVSLVLEDLSLEKSLTDGGFTRPRCFTERLENEVMVDPWSSMESSNSPLTDSPSTGSEDSTPSASEPAEPCGPAVASASTSAATCNDKTDALHSLENTKTQASRNDQCQISKPSVPSILEDKPRARDLTLDLENLDPELAAPRRRHFLDEDYQLPLRSNIDACRIPKPHFLDHSPSPDDERSDITNPNFLDEDPIDICDDSLQSAKAEAHRRSGAFPKRPDRPHKVQSSHFPMETERPHRTHYRSHLHYGLERAAHSSERDKRASQLYHGTWPGDGWPGQDTASVRSFSSAGSANAPHSGSSARQSAHIETKMECVYSLLSLLSLSPDNNADLSGPLLEMSKSVESCVAMRQSGCIPLLVQLIHSKFPRDTRNKAAQALHNIIHTQPDDKSGRREARVWRLLEQVREYCYVLEDTIEGNKDIKDTIDEGMTRHPSQSVAALMKLSFDEEHRHVVCQLGGLQALATLVSADQTAHGSHIEEGTCVTMRKYAGMTLTNLTFGDGNNKSLLCSFKDFMLALVEQLQSPNDDMRQVTSAVLRNLSWRADSNSKQVLREVGAVTGLTQAAMTCQKEATLKSVLSALWNLTAHCSMNKVALCSVDGALGFLVDMLSYNSPTKTLAIVENAGGIMRNVSSHIAIREDYRQILRERNCLSVLLQHLKSPSLTVVSNSCGTLWNLSARCPLDQQFLWDHGAVPMLRSLIHSKHKMIAMGSSAALKNLLNSKPGKNHIISLDSTARSMNLPVLPTLGARKQKALEQEIDQNLAETCDNIEPATSPSITNRDEKNLFSATERQLAMNLERHRMTSSSPLMGTLPSQSSLSHSAHLAGYLSCSNTLLKSSLVTRSVTGTSSASVNRSDSKDSVMSAHSDSVFEKATRIPKVPIPTPRSMKIDDPSKSEFAKPNDGMLLRYQTQPPVPPPRSGTEISRNNFTESGYDVDQDSCDQPIDFSRKYSETKSSEPSPVQLLEESKVKADIEKCADKDSEDGEKYGDYQETDLDQPTDYSLRYAEHQSEASSDSEPLGPSVHEDTIQHFCTEGTPYETPIVFSTATSISDLRVIAGRKDQKKPATNIKTNSEVMTQSDEKDTCSVEEPPHDNDVAVATSKSSSPPTKIESEKTTQFDTKFSSGMISPEKPVNYCDEGTPGCFSRVSSLSSLGDLADETSLAKKNAMATINMDSDLPEKDASTSARDKDGSKAVTFATEPAIFSQPEPDTPGATSVHTTSPPPQSFVEDTPLMFSRCSSPSSLSGCSIAEPMDDQGSMVSEISRLTSGCISPSEIPDSPGQSIPQSPRPRARSSHPAHPARGQDKTPPNHGGLRSVFEERVSTFQVENTPAQFSTATSLSSLTIDDEPSPSQHGATYRESNGVTTGQRPERATFDTWSETSQVTSGDSSTRLEPHDRIITPMTAVPAMMGHEPCTDSNPHREVQQPVDTCYTYFTEDTPAVLSKMGSDGNLSALSVETSAEPLRPVDNSSSDSSNLSDTGENLLNECIQKGIAKVLKNGSHSTEPLPANITQYPPKDQLYRSLPPYLVSSTETVKIQPEPMLNPSVHANVCRSDANSPNRTAHPLSSDESPPPPLPPKFNLGGVIRPPPRPPALLSIAVVAPASPPLSLGSDDERIFNQAIQQGIEKLKERKESRLPVKASSTKPPTNLVRNDSLSSLSIDSFGSTDREIFEECVNAGLSKVNPKAIFTLESKGKAHSVERVLETDPYRSSHRNHKSLDRSDKISNHRPHQSDLERLALAHQKKDKTKKKESGGMTRASHSYHGDTAAHSLAHHSRWGAPRYHDDGPPSLPVRIESHSSVVLERSNSLSSLSGESFGSTDKEVFDRIVKLGMKSIPKAKGDIKLDRPELRGSDFTIERPKLRIDNGEFRMVPEVRESHRSRRRRSDLLSLRPPAGALDKMTGEEDSMDRALLEEMIARGAGEIRPPNVSQSKNVQAPSVGRAPADGGVAPRDASAHLTPHTSTPRSGSDSQHHGLFNPNIYDTNSPNIGSDINSAHSGFNINNSDTSNMYTTDRDNTNDITLEFELNQSNEQPTVDSENTTSAALGQMDRSNEYHAIVSANTTIESEKDILDKSNESYADVLDGSVWSDIGSPPENYDCATLTRSNKNMKWTEINITSDNSDKKLSKKSTDTWNDNTCPDDVTFPTISGSVPMVASFKSDAADISTALPDLLEESLISNRSFTGPDLTDQLDEDRSQKITTINNMHTNFECIQDENEPSFNSLVNDVSNFNSMTASTIIEREAAQLVARLSNGFENQAMASSVLSYDLDSVKPPSNMGSLVSLTQSISGQLEDTTSLQSKKRQKSRKKSLPISLMVKRALTNSMTYHSSNEHLDSCPVSILDNVKPPSEMEHMDMESSMISVASIASEVAEQKENNNVIFDFDQPVSVFMTNPLNDLDHVNPPSLFNELGENTLEFEHTTALEMYDDCISNTLNLTTDFASGSEYCSPLQSDLSSVESTPKRMRNSKYLTPKEKRQLSKERYQTYTIADENTNQTDETISVNHVELESDLTLESDSRSEDYAIARSEHKSKRKISAKQRRLEDRARYQTQTVNISSIPLSNTVEKSPDPEIEHLKRRLAAKKTMRQKRLDDAERFRTRTIGDDVPPSPTYVTCDANFENFETTTGYDSFSSSELNHQQVTDDRVKSSDDNSTVDLQADSGTNDDDFELNSTQMQTYTKTFRNYLPVIESPTAVDICIVNNLKNIEMTASYRKTTPTYNIESIKDAEQQPGSSDFNSYEVEDNSDNSDSEPETLPIKVKPKIIKPTEIRRDASLDSNGSCDNDTPKGIRGRRKPVYVSPYKRTMPVVRKSPVRLMAPKLAPVVKPVTKLPVNPKVQAASKTRTPNKPFGSKIPSNIPPKKTPIDIPAKPSTSQNVSVPSVAVKPLPIERQGTFTKEESSVLPKERTFDKKSTVPLRLAKTGPVVKQSVNTSPSRLPQPKTGIVRPPLRKTLSNEPKQAPKKPNNTPNRTSLPAMKNSASNQSLQSNDSAKTVTLASKSDSRNGSTTNVNSSSSKVPKEVASKIASLWKRVEQSKQQQIKPDKRVWIGHTDIVVPESSETPKLIRSSTFEGPPGQITPVVAAPKTKSSIAIRVSQIPSSRFGSRPGTSKNVDKPSVTNGAVRRPTGVKVFTRKQLNNQEIAT